jgi:hypothetical protein
VESRKNHIQKVYASDSEGMDLLLFGQIDSQLKERSKTTVGFIAKLVFERNFGEESWLPTGGVKVKL